jgi:hypothetical protein
VKLWLRMLIGALLCSGSGEVTWLVTGSATADIAAVCAAVIGWSAGLIVGAR